MYWFPLRDRGVKRPVSSVKMRLLGTMHMSMELLVGMVVGIAVGDVVVGLVDRMCCRGCAMCPLWVSSASGQYLAANLYVSPGHVAKAPR